MLKRRDFLKTVAGGPMALAPIKAIGSRYQTSGSYYGVHPFIENNPDAVFIMKTNVDVKTNSEAKVLAGLDFGRSVLIPKDEADGGVPLTHNVAIKPNLTTLSKNPTEGTMGVFTDAYFIEGIIAGLNELGVSSGQIFLRETNSKTTEIDASGFSQMAARSGVSLKVNSLKVGVISENELAWVDTSPECVWFRKMPYLWPFNAPDTFFLNIAKFKAHGMGLTLAGKNIQGTLCHDYQELCSSSHYDGNMNIDPGHFKIDAHSVIAANFARHVADGIPRWEKPGTGWNSGLGMERWATRTIDNHISSNIGLHIVEGVYGRDGNGFSNGPYMADGTMNIYSSNGQGRDFMTNIIIFGKNPFHVDSIGHWLGGHEPGNLGYLHLALERGASTLMNPHSIPVYEWNADGSAALTPLDQFERTQLITYYLRRNYNSQTEPYWHMLDEPFDYGTVHVDSPAASQNPQAFVLRQNRPNPFNPNTAIEYSIPRGGYVRLEVFNMNGQLVEVLADGYMEGGAHMAVWNTGRQSSGTYFYRIRYGGFSETKKMVLLK